MGNLRKTNKKARKRLAYEKDVTAEKNRLFFTICTLFAGNHTDKIIIIKVRGDNSTEPLPPFFLLQILRARPASSLRARTVSQPAFSPSCPILASDCSPPAFFNPRHHSGHRFAGHTHTQAAESSRVSATKARDTPTRQHCSAMLGEKG